MSVRSRPALAMDAASIRRRCHRLHPRRHLRLVRRDSCLTTKGTERVHVIVTDDVDPARLEDAIETAGPYDAHLLKGG